MNKCMREQMSRDNTFCVFFPFSLNLEIVFCAVWYVLCWSLLSSLYCCYLLWIFFFSSFFSSNIFLFFLYCLALKNLCVCYAVQHITRLQYNTLYYFSMMLCVDFYYVYVCLYATHWMPLFFFSLFFFFIFISVYSKWAKIHNNNKNYLS